MGRTDHSRTLISRSLTTVKTYRAQFRWLLIPLAGILVFGVLYVIASWYYPGGSSADHSHRGFDWMYNYWCDLIAKYGKNGTPNPARPIALTAMVLLFSCLAVFWYFLPGFFHESKWNRIVIRFTGIVSMFILVFVFTPFHDTVIAAGSILSGIPLTATFRELYYHRMSKLFAFGCICLVFILLNFFMYFTGWEILWLPFLQKITLVLFLVWIFLIDLHCLFLLQTGRPDQPIRNHRNKHIEKQSGTPDTNQRTS